MPTFNKPRKPKVGRRILLVLIILLIGFFTKHITLDAKITIQQGENASKIFNELSNLEKLRMKLYLFNHKSIDFSKLEAGEYIFSGKYTKAEFIDKILQGAEKIYIRLTILEGRSIYDIDAALTRKGYITGGDYIRYTTDYGTLSELMQGYEFLRQIPAGKSTLEGFLYPDTYEVYKDQDITKQLVSRQLQNFNTRVRSKVSDPLNRYQTIILASIVEKEEKNNDNKATVAGIFFNRIKIGMALQADITLCYGLKQPYETCTPKVIGQNINDKNNPYNTRAVRELPPTPISNPTADSILAVLHPETTSYLYYLHDSKGIIHYGTTLDEHNANKAKYLR